jgi:hypothetical protein
MAALRTLGLRTVAVALLTTSVFVLEFTQVAQAQTLKEKLQQHVAEGVERSKIKAKKRKQVRRQREHAAEQDAPAVDDDAERSRPDEPETPPPKPRPSGPELPRRVFGKNAQFDLTFGFGYRGWFPQQYRAAEVVMGSYMTGSIDLRARLFGWLSLRRGHYESNEIAAPTTQEAAVAAKVGQFAPKAVWLLGTLGVPISKAWEPQIRYEARAFETLAKPRDSVCVVLRSAAQDAEDCPGTRGELKIISSFETLVAGVRYDASKSSGAVLTSRGSPFPPIFFGLGLLQYHKPYQLTLDGFTLDDYLFDARFRGAGAAFAAELGGGIDNFFGEVDAQLGLGEVSLTDELTLNELIPDRGLIGYLQGSATLGYRIALMQGPPTLILAPVLKAGGATFFLIDTQSGDGDAAASPTVNWDFLWSIHASLLVPI